MSTNRWTLAALLIATVLIGMAGTADAAGPIEHRAWIKLKVSSRGLEFDGPALLGKAKTQATCYMHLAWADNDPAGGDIYCEETPGTWSSIGGGGMQSFDAKFQLVSGGCGLFTPGAALAGPCWFRWRWKAAPDGALEKASVSSVSGYLTGSIDGSSGYVGDIKMKGKSIPQRKVPAALVTQVLGP